jgi:hypothetical protein
MLDAKKDFKLYKLYRKSALWDDYGNRVYSTGILKCLDIVETPESRDRSNRGSTLIDVDKDFKFDRKSVLCDDYGNRVRSSRHFKMFRDSGDVRDRSYIRPTLLDVNKDFKLCRKSVLCDDCGNRVRSTGILKCLDIVETPETVVIDVLNCCMWIRILIFFRNSYLWDDCGNRVRSYRHSKLFRDS